MRNGGRAMVGREGGALNGDGEEGGRAVGLAPAGGCRPRPHRRFLCAGRSRRWRAASHSSCAGRRATGESEAGAGVTKGGARRHGLASHSSWTSCCEHTGEREERKCEGLSQSFVERMGTERGRGRADSWRGLTRTMRSSCCAAAGRRSMWVATIDILGSERKKGVIRALTRSCALG